MTTETKYELKVDVRPTRIQSAIVFAPFDEGMKLLENEGYDIISLQENARLRMQQGKDAFISQNGNWVKEGVIYIPKKGNKLVRESPILYNSINATQAHREGKDFYPSKGYIDQVLSDSIDFPTKNSEIPTNRFGENELTAWAFGDFAQAYGNFLKDSGIQSMPTWSVDQNYVNQQDKPFARQLWFDWLDGRSGLIGDNWYLHCDFRVRGVLQAAEGSAAASQISTSPSQIESYTPARISEALRELKIEGLEDQILSQLDK